MLKSILVSSLIFQLVWSPTVFAVEEPDTGFWKNKIVGQKGDDCDPWLINCDPNAGSTGGTTPGWSNTGPTSGWDDPTTPIGSSWGSGSFFSSGTYDDPILKWLGASDVVTAPYEQEIAQLILDNPTKNLDELADRIISEGKTSAISSSWYTAAAFFVTFMATSRFSNSGGVWGGIASAGAMAVASYFEVSAVFNSQATMILKLDALYGGIGKTPYAKVERIKDAFSIITVLATVENFAARAIAEGLQAKMIAAAAAIAKAAAVAPATAPVLTPQVTQSTLVAAEQAVAAAAQAAVPKVLATTASQVTGTVPIQQANGTITEVPKVTVLNRLLGFFKNPESQKFAAGAFATLLVAAVSVGINYFHTGEAGQKYKTQFQQELADREAMGLAAIAQSSEARHALWLILTRDVFNRMAVTKKIEKTQKVVKVIEGKRVEVTEPTVKLLGIYKPNFPIPEQERFASVVAQMVPLYTSSVFGSEFEEMSKEFKENPKIIDNYLNNLREQLSVEAKIWFMKILLTGMYVKGRLNDGDKITIHTVAKLLALETPTGKLPAPTDTRNLQIGRYKMMFNQIEKAVSDRQRILAGLTQKAATLSGEEKTALEQLEKRGVSGQIIYENFQSVCPRSVELYIKAAKKGTPESEMFQAINLAIDEKVAGCGKK